MISAENWNDHISPSLVRRRARRRVRRRLPHSTRAQELLEQRFPQVSGATPRSAVLTWLGERAWRLPRWLDRLLIDLGGSARLKAAPEGQSL